MRQLIPRGGWGKALAALVGLGATSAALSAALHEAQSVAAKPVVVTAEGKPGRFVFWLETSLKRVFLQSAPGAGTLDLLAARNSKLAFQACFRNERRGLQNLTCTVRGADDLKPQMRFVGLAPMPHFTPDTDPSELDGAGLLPGFVPDPLLPTNKGGAGPQESRSFWITLNVPADAQPGRRTLTVRLSLAGGKEPIDLPVNLDISPLILQPRKNFHVIHWWRGEATWNYYKTGMFDERWWQLTKGQLENMLAHGSDVVYVPLFFDRRETFKRPCQLLVVNEPRPGKYELDWSAVKRFTDLCKRIGFKHFEWSHLWIYWGVENPMRIYKKVGDHYVMLWPPDISGFSATYVSFLKQFLPAFHQFLKDEELLETSYFHLSDEPGGGRHVANYRRARKILHDLAPWMKVMDALSDIRYGKEGLTDIPVPMVNAAQAYIDAKIPHWVYYCCFPQGPWLNRFLDTPLPKVRMAGWLFYRLGAKGFLHWGFNYWDKMEREEAGDPFHDASNASWPGIPYGDPFVIYPGPDGPIDSIRWEVFAESLQDYALLQTAGVKPDDPLLADLKSYAIFPKNEEWLRKTLRKILKAPKPVEQR